MAQTKTVRADEATATAEAIIGELRRLDGMGETCGWTVQADGNRVRFAYDGSDAPWFTLSPARWSGCLAALRAIPAPTEMTYTNDYGQRKRGMNPASRASDRIEAAFEGGDAGEWAGR
jgi:hypothetical protein